MAEYLAIKNWEKFQSLRRSGKWIKDYTAQDDEPELAKLTMFQRGVLQELRRIRGRLGKNIPFDFDFIARAMHALPTDCSHIGHAIDTMVLRGILILTPQQHNSTNSSESKKEKEIEKEKEQNHSARLASREPVVEQAKPKPKPESVFDKAYASYPRHIGKRAAERAWGQAVNRESAKAVRTNAEHEDFIYQQVMHYGAACKRFNKPREFIPHMATWLNQDRFLDDPSEWEVTRQEQRNGNGTTKAEQRNADISKTTREVFGEALGVLRDAPKSLPLKTPT